MYFILHIIINKLTVVYRDVCIQTICKTETIFVLLLVKLEPSDFDVSHDWGVAQTIKLWRGLQTLDSHRTLEYYICQVKS